MVVPRGAITHGLVLMAMVAVPAPSGAGNSALMERNAAELIDINQEVLEGLKAGSQDGEYRLMARIVEQNGERVIKVDRFEHAGPPDPQGENSRPFEVRTTGITGGGKAVLAPFGDPSPSIRFGPIPAEYRTSPQGAPSAAGLATAPLPIPLTDGRQKLEVLFNSHPNIQLIDLTPEDIKQLAPLKSINIGGGAALLYW
ncbi:MAG: hypothetical protein KBE53_02125 [Chromatiaceae bacterium]|nr:hypothetical protein [Chromatiaceae bacterium]